MSDERVGESGADIDDLKGKLMYLGERHKAPRPKKIRLAARGDLTRN